MVLGCSSKPLIIDERYNKYHEELDLLDISGYLVIVGIVIICVGIIVGIIVGVKNYRSGKTSPTPPPLSTHSTSDVQG